MSSGGTSKKSGGSGGPCGQSTTINATPSINPTAQPEYLVEKITGKRYWNGRPQVLVKWEGYPPEESTWEPMENIGNCMVLLADFEAELFKRKEHKKSLQKVLNQNMARSPASPACKKKAGKLPGAAQATSAKQPKEATHKAPDFVERRLEIGQSTGPKANVTNSGIPKPNAGHKIGDPRENPLAKSPTKQRPTSPMQLCELSDDDDPFLLDPSSLDKRAPPQASMPPTALLAEPSSTSAAVPQQGIVHEASDIETISSGSSRSSSPSYRSSGSSTGSSVSGSHPLSLLAAIKHAEMYGLQKEEAVEWQAKTNKKALAATKTVTHSSTSGDPVDQALKTIHSNQVVTPITPTSSPRVQNPVQGSSKKIKQQTLLKGMNKESSDDDSDNLLMPQTPRTVVGTPGSRVPARGKLNPNAKGFNWKMPLRKAPFGLARGLELDKVVHNFKVRGKQFMFVHWKGVSSLDAVPLDDLKVAFPAQVIQYFENMERRHEDSPD